MKLSLSSVVVVGTSVLATSTTGFVLPSHGRCDGGSNGLAFVTLSSSSSSSSSLSSSRPYSWTKTSTPLRMSSEDDDDGGDVMIMAELPDILKKEVETSDVVMFSKSDCAVCDKTKTKFIDSDIEVKIVELDKVGNGGKLETALVESTPQKSPPFVFVKGMHLGGIDHTQAAISSGIMKEMLQ